MVIVAAVDRSDRSEAVIDEAVRLAKAFGEPVHVVHALSESEFVDLELTATEETGRALSMDRVKEFAEERAARAAADMAVEHEAVGLVGNAAKEVVAYAEEVDASYIVVAPRKRSPAGKAIFGSVAQSILLDADRPVVTTVRPSG